MNTMLNSAIKHLLPLTFAAMASLPAVASADNWVPDSHLERAGGKIFWNSNDNVGSGLPIIGFLHMEVADDIFLDVQLPLGMNINGFDDETRFGFGNPAGGVRYVTKHDSKLRWWAGGGATLPLGAINNNDIQAANFYSNYALGGYDSYLYAQDTLAFYGTGGVDYRIHKNVSLQGSVDPLLYISLGDNSSSEFGFQTSIGAEYRHASGFGVGGGFKLVALFTTSGSDQVLFDPHASYSKDGLLIRAGFRIALDKPYGFAFDPGGVLSPNVSVGFEL